MAILDFWWIPKRNLLRIIQWLFIYHLPQSNIWLLGEIIFLIIQYSPLTLCIAVVANLDILFDQKKIFFRGSRKEHY